MPYYPVNLQIHHQSCVIVGGGSIAERKAISLLAAGAAVTILSPHITQRLVDLAEKKEITHIARPYQSGDVEKFFIVICATNNGSINKLVAEEGMKSGALVNVVDAPELGNFTVPSQIAHGDLLLTVSTGGKSPAFARRLREELAERYGPEYGIYLDLLAKARVLMKRTLPTAKDRENFWRQAIDRDVIVLLKEGKIKEAEAKIYNAIGCTGTQS